MLARLFETDAARPNLLRRRESTWLELKENFSISPDSRVEYGRTMAAFSNRDGGYILFGVKNSPHILQGMTNNRFDQFDPRTLSIFLADHFSPNIDWQHFPHQIGERRFGIIYVSSAKRKPVVCTCNNDKLRDGDIYYRYQGETRIIASSEIHGLINDLIDYERKSWRALLSKTAQTVPSATYLLDTTSGRADGASGSFVLSEQLLDRINFIREGRFTEDGEPTLRVIGDVEVVRTETVPVPQPFPTDPANTHPLLQKDLMLEINREFGAGTANQHDFQCVKRVHRIHENPGFYYINTIGVHAPQYSREYLNWLVDQFRQNAQFFAEARQQDRETRG